MKKLFTLLALLSVTAFSHAQDFGKTLVSGSISYSSSLSKNKGYTAEIRSSQFSVSPKVGFFVSPRVAIGVAAGYGSTSSPELRPMTINTGYSYETVYAVIENETRSFNVGPFVRIYQALGEKAAFFGQASAFYSHAKSEYRDTYTSLSTTKGGQVSVSPGFVFFPTSRIGLELSLGNLGYSLLETKRGDASYATKTRAFDADFGLSSLSLGISLYLGRSAAE